MFSHFEILRTPFISNIRKGNLIYSAGKGRKGQEIFKLMPFIMFK